MKTSKIVVPELESEIRATASEAKWCLIGQIACTIAGIVSIGLAIAAFSESETRFATFFVVWTLVAVVLAIGVRRDRRELDVKLDQLRAERSRLAVSHQTGQ